MVRSARAWLALLALLGLLLAAGCNTQRTLSKDEVDNRAQEYFQRGMDQFQKGEFRAALESFRMARAYDARGVNVQIPEMIEKTEQKLRIAPSGPAVAARPPDGPAPKAPPAPAPPSRPAPAPDGAAPQVAQPPTAKPDPEPVFKTYRSRVYPYAIDIPEDWSLDPSDARVPGMSLEVLAAPKRGGLTPDLSIFALRLLPDVDQRAFVEAMRTALKAGRIEPVEVGKRLVDGASATLLRASTTDEEGKHVTTLAVFEINRLGWLVMFDASADDSDRLQPLFHQMLDTFRHGEPQSVV